VKIRTHPWRSARSFARLRRLTEDGVPEVYVALRSRVGRDGRPWIQVRVPMRPNGRRGWVPRAALGRLRIVRTHLVVDRRSLTATLRRRHRVVWRSRVGVGAPGTPTPGGSFYVRELLRPPSPDGLYGPYAFGTSAYSVLSDWPGGGVVGIHGTNAPSLIPGRPSHGCIRVPNERIRRLARLMPIGTPVRIL
jgi:L,D-transpeptidase catalytic domain